MNNNEKTIFDFITKEEYETIREFSKNKETPFLIINLKKIDEKYQELKENMPYAKIYYAVKANPNIEILKLLADKGACFDIASIYELDLILSLGVTPDRLSYGNTIKKEKDIKYAYQKGIRLFVTDSRQDLKKISINAPGSRVFFRIIAEGGDSDWPLSRKFGATPDVIYHLVIESKSLGLNPYGISFHVGSQQRDISQWDQAISQVKYLFDSLKEEGIELKLINMGGGFPAHYLRPTQEITTYTKEITRRLKEDFKDNFPEIIIEPGRSLVADSGVIVTEIVLSSKKSMLNQYEWMYLDCGVYSGLTETINESIRYPIFPEKQETSENKKQVILAGPTCDSFDLMYIQNKYTFPIDIKDGDRLYILTTGAYTDNTSSVGFNGFPPLKAYVIK